MQMKLSAPKSPRVARQKKGLVLALALGCSVCTGNAGAQWIVSDPILEGQTATANVTEGTQLAKQILQYEQQIQQYTTQLEQLRNILTKIQSLGSNISLVPKSLEKLSPAQQDQLVDQACPGAPLGGVITGAISGLLGSSNDQPITQRQQLICKEIALLQVDQYNITATALGELTVQQSTVQKLGNVVSSISTLGESNSATSQAQGYIAQLQTASDTWNAQIKADKAMIDTLEQQQGILAKVALTGGNTILGNVVQAAALKAAFAINQ